MLSKRRLRVLALVSATIGITLPVVTAGVLASLEYIQEKERSRLAEDRSNDDDYRDADQLSSFASVLSATTRDGQMDGYAEADLRALRVGVLVRLMRADKNPLDLLTGYSRQCQGLKPDNGTALEATSPLYQCLQQFVEERGREGYNRVHSVLLYRYRLEVLARMNRTDLGPLIMALKMISAMTLIASSVSQFGALFFEYQSERA